MEPLLLALFRTWERLCEAVPSETFRDLLQRADKVGFISNVAQWISMRALRNRIPHEYLPYKIAKNYAVMVGEGAQNPVRLQRVVEHLQ
jgi:hypothetical protein